MLEDEKDVNAGEEAEASEEESNAAGEEEKKDEAGSEEAGAGEENKGEEQGEKEELDPEKFDERGVPWKKRAKENERKYIEALEKRLEEKEPAAEENNGDDNGDDDLTKNQRKVAREEFSKLTRAQQRANSTFDEVFGEMVAENPGMKEVAEEARKATLSLPSIDRGIKAREVENIILWAWGMRNRKAKPAAEPKKLVAGAKKPDFIPPSGKGKSGGGLNSDVKAWAEEMRLTDDDWTDQEIQDLYNKRHAKK